MALDVKRLAGCRSESWR